MSLSILVLAPEILVQRAIRLAPQTAATYQVETPIRNKARQRRTGQENRKDSELHLLPSDDLEIRRPIPPSAPISVG